MTSSIATAPMKDSAEIPSVISSQQPTKSLLPSSSQMEHAPLTVEPRFIPVVIDDDEEEGGMPTIDMESDSDG
jgi:hypothetical protein